MPHAWEAHGQEDKRNALLTPPSTGKTTATSTALTVKYTHTGLLLCLRMSALKQVTFTPWEGRTLSGQNFTCFGGQSWEKVLSESAQLSGGVNYIGPTTQSKNKWVCERADAAGVFGNNINIQLLSHSQMFWVKGKLRWQSSSCVSMAITSITRNHRKLEVYLYIKIHENTKSSKKTQ